MRNIFAIILILGAIGIYYGYTKHVFADIGNIKVQLTEYKETLNKANQLQEEQQQLTELMNSFSETDREKLNKLIPDNADNVRLILDIQNIAQGSGLSIKNIKINEENKQGSSDPVADAESFANGNAIDKYNYITLSFTVTSTYSNFVPFIKKLEQSLRLVDITALAVKPTGETANLYDFDVTLRAYWLK